MDLGGFRGHQPGQSPSQTLAARLFPVPRHQQRLDLRPRHQPLADHRHQALGRGVHGETEPTCTQMQRLRRLGEHGQKLPGLALLGGVQHLGVESQQQPRRVRLAAQDRQSRLGQFMGDRRRAGTDTAQGLLEGAIRLHLGVILLEDLDQRFGGLDGVDLGDQHQGLPEHQQVRMHGHRPELLQTSAIDQMDQALGRLVGHPRVGAALQQPGQVMVEGLGRIGFGQHPGDDFLELGHLAHGDQLPERFQGLLVADPAQGAGAGFKNREIRFVAQDPPQDRHPFRPREIEAGFHGQLTQGPRRPGTRQATI